MQCVRPAIRFFRRGQIPVLAHWVALSNMRNSWIGTRRNAEIPDLSSTTPQPDMIDGHELKKSTVHCWVAVVSGRRADSVRNFFDCRLWARIRISNVYNCFRDVWQKMLEDFSRSLKWFHRFILIFIICIREDLIWKILEFEQGLSLKRRWI